LNFATEKKARKPEIIPITMAPEIFTKPAAGIIATRPATAPEASPRRGGVIL
jgi:hypothetical protein